jgi:hypothetical protein
LHSSAQISVPWSVPAVSGGVNGQADDVNRPKEMGSATCGGDGDAEGITMDIGAGTQFCAFLARPSRESTA